MELAVRELEEQDLDALVRYWTQAEPAYLEGMGVELSKLPSKDEWEQMLTRQLQTPLPEKQSYCLIWELDSKPVGHCNVNKIVFGQEAYMHLHLWPANLRKQGLGTAFVNLSLPYFFHNLHLQKLICEPYALNPAPHKTLEEVGFTFIKEHTTVPGSINFEQKVKRFELTLEQFTARTRS